MKKSVLLLTLIGGWVLAQKSARADDSAVPAAGYSASRYEILWTKSPFAVASSEAVQESPDYSMVGIAQFDGISYVSLIERQSQEHFLVSSDKPTRGLTVTSINRGHDGADTYATVQKDGQPLTLKLEQAPAVATVPMPGANVYQGANISMPGSMTPQISMPGANAPATTPGSTRPLIRLHRPTIHLPPAPAQQPVQAHTPPPPPQ